VEKKRRRVLIVEDEAVIAMAEADSLSEAGYDPIHAFNAVQALACLQAPENGVDLVLVDIDLGRGMDGASLAKSITRTHDIPIIFLSSHTEPEFVEMTAGIPSYGYVPKPAGMSVLNASISMAFRLWSARKELEINQDMIRRLSKAVECCPSSIIITDADGTIEYVNPRFTELTGYSFEDAVGRKPNLLKTGHTSEEEYRLLWETISSGREWRGEFLNRKKNGELYWESASIAPILGDSNKSTHYVATKEDITGRKFAENERAAMMSVLKIINEKNDLHELMRLLSEFLKGWSACEAVGIRLRNGPDFPYFETLGFPPDFLQQEAGPCLEGENGNSALDERGLLETMCGNVLCGRFDPALEYFTAHGSFWTNDATELLSRTIEPALVAGAWSRRNVLGCRSVALVPLRMKGEVLGLLQLNDTRPGLFSPSTVGVLERMADSVAIALAHRSMEEEQRKSAEMFKALAENSPMGIFIFRKNQIVYLNQGAIDIFKLEGSSDPWMTGKTWANRFCLDGVARSAAIKSGNFHLDRHQVFCKDGSQSWVEIFGRRLESESGMSEMIAVLDLTQRIALERKARIQQNQLIQSEKLASLGILVAGVAHEINNPNHSILLNANLLDDVWKSIGAFLDGMSDLGEGFLIGGLEYADLKQDVPLLISGIADSSRVIDGIVNNLKSFVRPDDSTVLEKVNLNLAVKAAATLLSPLLGKSTRRFTLRLSEISPIIEGLFPTAGTGRHQSGGECLSGTDRHGSGHIGIDAV
jgi:PAS domain S-box-containing protein